MEGLNDALSLEYQAFISYKQHEAIINLPFASFIAEHADDEAKHIGVLTQHIVLKRRLPTIQVAPPFTASDDANIVQLDLQAEKTAASLYTDLIEMAEEMGDQGTAAVLQPILTDELDHISDLQRME